MSEVYANGHEVSAKADSNKSMAAMPDVCLSPPPPPAGPIPIPYPNFAFGSDTTDGTKTVRIGGQEVGIKNTSSYKQSTGDEAATKSLGMNVISHNITGKMKHAAWSMDVKFEGENAIRQLDLTTHNHTNAGGGAFTGNGGRVKKVSRRTTCKKLDDANQEAVKEKRPKAQNVPKGQTVATAHHSSPSGGLQVSASSHMSGMANRGGWTFGHKDEKSGEFKESKMCADAKKDLEGLYVTRGRGKNQSPMCHAESRIIETVFARRGANPGGTLTLRIAWKGSSGERAKSKPCETCRKMLCAVQEHCGVKVVICKSPDKKPQPIKCT
jgi:Toxin PAAR-like domain